MGEVAVSLLGEVFTSCSCLWDDRDIFGQLLHGFSSSARYSVQHCVSKPKLSHGPSTKSRRDPVLPIHFAEMAISPVAKEQDSDNVLKFLEPVKPDCLWV